MKLMLSQLLPWIDGASLTRDALINGVATDSRSATEGKLFVALRGERFDAHDFLPLVSGQGAAGVMVERTGQNCNLPALVVPDTRIALGQIAAYWRQQFALPVIGVAGSNGKTTVKEMIASILAEAFGAGKCLATQGNLNNDIGVPLTVLRLEPGHQAAVVELGMNHPGEIAVLASIARPTVGLVTNAQREHQEFMKNVAAVAGENGAVIAGLPHDGVAVFPQDDPFCELWRSLAIKAGKRRIVSFGLSADADVSCSFIPNCFGSVLNILVRNGTKHHGFEAGLATPGLHNVRNALAAVAATYAIGIPAEVIARGLEAFAPANGRLQRKRALNAATIFDDTYNANPDSVRAAIDVLAQVPAPRILVLGDMGEVGSEGRQFHEEIGAYAYEQGVNVLFTLGDLARHAADAFGAQAMHFQAIDTLIQTLSGSLTPATSVLVKGSRFMKMERVVAGIADQSAFLPLQGVH